MTDQTQDNTQRVPTRRLNGSLVFCVLCLILAIGIYLAGGSAIFASLFGAISLYGIMRNLFQPGMVGTTGTEGAVSNTSTGHPIDGEDKLKGMFEREEAMLLDPEYGLLSNNMFNRSRNPTKYNDDYD